MNESIDVLSREITDSILELSYATSSGKFLIEIPDYLNELGNLRGPALLQFLQEFHHDEYGICWTLDLEKNGFDYIEPGILKMQFDVSWFRQFKPP